MVKHLIMVLMTMVATIAGAAPQVVDNCSWDRPGGNRFTGNVVSAVDHYTDIAPATRAKLKARLAQPTSYDDVVTITRTSVRGNHRYDPELTNMHFGSNQMCRSVTRSKWPSSQTERGLVFCEDGVCLVMPTVCGNLSRITRSAGTTSVTPLAPISYQPIEPPPPLAENNELLFDPPGAGPASQPPTVQPLATEVPSGSVIGPTQSVAFPPVGYIPPAVLLPIPVTPPVPEPSTWLLMALGLLIVGIVKKRA